MLFERIDDAGLSQDLYFLACEDAALAAVIDPRRDVDVYLTRAARRDLRIAHVFETHVHADFASGARELAERTGARLWLSAYDAGELYETQFTHQPMHDGDAVTLGKVRIEARHTPGHTPEHLSFLVYDGARAADVPMVMLSGDFLFVGSLGRPDLLGEDAKRQLARRLYSSVRNKLRDLPDGLEIAPGHGAGSLCGTGMSSRAVSTVGFERVANPYLRDSLTEDEFVAMILGDLPPVPDYYRRMKTLNSEGPPLLNGLPGITALSFPRFRRLVDAGHVVIDLRDQLGFGAGHVPGSFGIGGGSSLSMWAAWVVPYEEPLVLIGRDERQIEAAVRSLVRVGLDDVRGYLEGGIDTWVRAGAPLAVTPQISPAALAARLQDGEPIAVLDVRSDAEWSDGHIAGARHLMAGDLPHRIAEVESIEGPIAVVCGTGYRLTVASSVLQRAGVSDTINVTGGMRAWQAAGLPTVKD